MKIWFFMLLASFCAHAVVVERDLPYSNGLRLDLYRPDRDLGRGVVVMIHGGGWRHGSKDGFDEPLRWAVAEGFNAVAINYRLNTPHPAAEDDVNAAIRWVKRAFPGQALFLFGESAGGHLALLAAHEARAVAVFYPPTDLPLLAAQTPDAYLKECVAGVFGRQAAQASPLRLLDVRHPPVLLVHGDADTVVPVNQSQMFARRVGELGVKHKLHVLAGEKHGFTPANRRWAFTQAFNFFKAARP